MTTDVVSQTHDKQAIWDALTQIRAALRFNHVPGIYDPEHPQVQWMMTLTSPYGEVSSSYSEGLQRIERRWPHLKLTGVARKDAGIHKALRKILQTGLLHNVHSLLPTPSAQRLASPPIGPAMAALFLAAEEGELTREAYAALQGMPAESRESYLRWTRASELATALKTTLGPVYAQLRELCVV